MKFEIWITFLAATTLMSLFPGAGTVATIGNSLSHGAQKSLYGIAGLQTGLLVHIMLAGAGLGALIVSSATAFELLKWAGACYLIWLGVMKFREKSELNVENHPETSVSPGGLYTKCVLVNLTNPKSTMFLAALFPQFMTPDAPQLPQIAILGATLICVDASVMVCYALTASRVRHRLKQPETVKRQNRLMGSLLMGAGVLLATAKRN